MATFRLRSVRKRERGRKGKNGVVEKQRRKKSPHENPSDSSQEKAAQSRLRVTPLSDTRTSISRASFSNSLNSLNGEAKFREFFETSPRSRLGHLGRKNNKEGFERRGARATGPFTQRN